MKFVAFYSINVEIEAEDEERAKLVARDTRRRLDINGPILLEVRDETLIVNLERLIEWNTSRQVILK